MLEQRQKKVLILALFAGEIMMRSGAEIYRVEDTITRICRACKIPYVECFATTTGIFLSIDSGDSDSDTHTFIKRIRRVSTDLDKISRINRFSRLFTSTDLSIEAGFEQLRAIDKGKPYGVPLNTLGAFLVGGSLCPCFGGNLIDAGFCAVITALAYLASVAIGRLQLNAFISVFLSCAVCAALSLFTLNLGLTSVLSALIIASITIFMPGVAITNAARDLLSGDMLAGVARFAEALIIAVAIAGGVGFVLKFGFLALGGLPTDSLVVYPLYAFFLFAFLTTLGFCILFHVPVRQMLPAAFVGALGFLLYEYLLLDDRSVIIAAFFSSGLVALMGEICSRAGRDATTLFIIPGIIPLVPGTGMYATMLYLMQGDFAQTAATGSSTFIIAGSIAIALVIVASLSRMVTAAARRLSLFAARLRAGRRGLDGGENGYGVNDEANRCEE